MYNEVIWYTFISRLINNPSPHTVTICVCLARTFKIYSPSNCWVYSTVLWSIVSMLYIRSPERTHIRSGSLHPLNQNRRENCATCSCPMWTDKAQDIIVEVAKLEITEDLVTWVLGGRAGVEAYWSRFKKEWEKMKWGKEVQNIYFSKFNEQRSGTLLEVDIQLRGLFLVLVSIHAGWWKCTTRGEI